MAQHDVAPFLEQARNVRICREILKHALGVFAIAKAFVALRILGIGAAWNIAAIENHQLLDSLHKRKLFGFNCF